MAKTYLSIKDETIRVYKSLAEVSPACTESTSLADIFHAMTAPSRLACNIRNGSVYPGLTGTLEISKTEAHTGTAIFVDADGRMSTGGFPWTGWQSPGYSNPNLLINWDFRHPVNQRGQNEYTNSKSYTIDMWFTGFDGEKSIRAQNGCIEMVTNTIATWFNLEQLLETPLTNETYTLSFLVDDTTKVSQLYVSSVDEIIGVNYEFSNNIRTYTFTVGKNESIRAVGIQKREEIGSLKIYAVKLEVGSVSTLALDLMQPPNYAEQLRLCQRYYEKGIVNATIASKENYAETGTFTNGIACKEKRVPPTYTIGDAWVPGFYGIEDINQEAFSVNDIYTYVSQKTEFYLFINKQIMGEDKFHNMLGRPIVFTYEANAEL